MRTIRRTRRRKAVPKYRKLKRRGRSPKGFASLYDGKRETRTYFPGRWGSDESREAYRAWLAVYNVADRRVLIATDPGAILKVSDVISTYRQYAEVRYGGKSEWSHLGLVCDAIVNLFGAMPAAQFRQRHVKAVRAAWLADNPTRRYVNQRLQRLKRIWGWLLQEELVSPESLIAVQSIAPLARGEFGVREGRKVQEVAWENVEPILDAVSPVVASMIRVHWFTGMRSGNLCDMTPGRIDRTGDVWLYIPEHHKTEDRGERLVIALGPQAQSTLASLMDRPENTPLFSPRESVAWRNEQRRTSRKTPHTPTSRARKTSTYLHCNDRYNSHSYRRAILYGIDAVNHGRGEDDQIERWWPHRLRHSRGTIVRGEHGLEAAQATLGHATIDATQLYAEKRIQLAVEVARHIG